MCPLCFTHILQEKPIAQTVHTKYTNDLRSHKTCHHPDIWLFKKWKQEQIAAASYFFCCCLDKLMCDERLNEFLPTTNTRTLSHHTQIFTRSVVCSLSTNALRAEPFCTTQLPHEGSDNRCDNRFA